MWAPPEPVDCPQRRRLGGEEPDYSLPPSRRVLAPGLRTRLAMLQPEPEHKFLPAAAAHYSARQSEAGVSPTTGAADAGTVVDLAEVFSRVPSLPRFASESTLLVCDHLADYGIYVLYEPSISAVRVRFSTFYPPAVDECFNS
jgi:hypothetical protein